ncbi:MAG: hypothetical protein R2940_11950 [Syntrophotaleaceae bacterium]
MAEIKIYLLTCEAIPLRPRPHLGLFDYGLAKVWVQAKGPDEALLFAVTYLVEFGLTPRSLEKPPMETTAADYSGQMADLARFRKAENSGVALHLDGYSPGLRPFPVNVTLH